jgi:hypothetical protein
MKWQLLKSALAYAFVASIGTTALAEDETQFCRALRADRVAKQAWPVRSDTIWYRGPDGKIAELVSSLPARSVYQLFYYVRDEDRPAGDSSILNIKLAYRVPPKQSQRKYVDLRNNKWESFSADKQNKVRSICGRVAPQEYEQFHLQNTRSYCLQYFFHQSGSDEFRTIAFPAQRESFAFEDMLGDAPSGNIGDFLVSLLTPTKAKAADPASKTDDPGLSTAPNSHIRSWIKNYRYGDSLGRCLSIEPNIPETAMSLLLRITNHRNYELRTRTWKVDISQ